MQELNLFAIYTEILAKDNIEYFISGSVAAIVYGEPRLTNDIDLIISTNLSGSFSFIQMGKASTPANSLNITDLPSITGKAALGPISPKPKTAVPSVTTAM